MKKYSATIFFLLFAHLIILAIFVAFRIAGGDEGFYLNAARMVNMGMSIYTDFFYTQFIMMPTIFAPFAGGGWESFYTLRSFAALAGFLSAVLLSLILLRTTRDYKSAAIALFLYVFSGMIIVWHTSFKPLAFCHFLSLGTFFFWLMYYEKRGLLYLLFSGLFLSALVNFRPVFVVLLPLYLLSMLYLSNNFRLKHLSVFIASLVPFAIPTFLKILQSPEHFFIGNWFFQLNREVNQSFGFIFYNRLNTFLRVILDPHLLIIFSLLLFSLYMLVKKKRIRAVRDLFIRPEGMAVANLMLIAAVNLVPHPVLRQYVSQFLAFGIIVIGFNLDHILTFIEKHFKPLARKLVIAIIASVYLISIIPYIAIFIFGYRSMEKRYVLSEVKKVTNKMLSLAEKSDTILAEWSGYTFLTGQKNLPYTEILGTEYKLPLSHDEYMKYKLCDNIYLKEQVEQKTPDLVVTVYKPPEYYADALENNYDGVFQSDVVTIYKRK
jgi:4-amino-4-deoxy-L-arabinose transferase-like glycosyltransferase